MSWGHSVGGYVLKEHVSNYSRIRSPAGAALLDAGAPQELGLLGRVRRPHVGDGRRGAQERQEVRLAGQEGDDGRDLGGLEEAERRVALQVGDGDNDAPHEVVAVVVGVVGEDHCRGEFTVGVEAGLGRFGDRQGGARQGGRRREVCASAENHNVLGVSQR